MRENGQYTAEDIDHEYLHSFGFANPCSFFSREMYEDTGGYPPCTIHIPDYEAFDAALEDDQSGIDYIAERISGGDWNKTSELFWLNCSCPACTA